jgi:hypothetical protein
MYEQMSIAAERQAIRQSDNWQATTLADLQSEYDALETAEQRDDWMTRRGLIDEETDKGDYSIVNAYIVNPTTEENHYFFIGYYYEGSIYDTKLAVLKAINADLAAEIRENLKAIIELEYKLKQD